MKLKTHHDLDIPIADLFRILCDTQRWERAAMRKGVEVARLDSGEGAVAGANWKASGEWRGKKRQVELTLRTLQPQTLMLFDFASESFRGVSAISLVDLSAKRTRLAIEIELKAQTLAARIMLQGAKLARQKIQRRFSQKIGTSLKDLVPQAG